MVHSKEMLSELEEISIETVQREMQCERKNKEKNILELWDRFKICKCMTFLYQK
jgi:predicted transcriptional regulator YdeE